MPSYALHASHLAQTYDVQDLSRQRGCTWARLFGFLPFEIDEERISPMNLSMLLFVLAHCMHSQTLKHGISHLEKSYTRGEDPQGLQIWAHYKTCIDCCCGPFLIFVLSRFCFWVSHLASDVSPTFGLKFESLATMVFVSKWNVQ